MTFKKLMVGDKFRFIYFSNFVDKQLYFKHSADYYAYADGQHVGKVCWALKESLVQKVE